MVRSLGKWIKNAPVFLTQVWEEAQRIIWPSRRDVILTGIVVIIFAIIFGIFLASVDEILIRILRFLFNVSNG